MRLLYFMLMSPQAVAQVRADAIEQELNRSLALIDTVLVAHASGELKRWQETVGNDVHGVLRSLRRESLLESRPFSYKELLEEGGIKVDMKHGCAVQEAATLFRAYEITGERTFLETGLKFCDFLVRAQEFTGGYWARTYILNAAGEIMIPGASFTGSVREGEQPIVRSSWLSAEEKTCRLQDHYQSRPFYLLLYAFRLAGDDRYFEAARRVADVVLSLQNENGSWADEWDFSITDAQFWMHGTRGVRLGGSFNDDATGDGMRMLIQMYLMTGEKKYIDRLGHLGQWLFDTQIGKGDVRGWCQQYDLTNRPIAARSQEMAAIQNLTFTQFVAPMLTWFYAITGDEAYARLMRETYAWIKSVEQPDGWAYQYLSDGTPVFSTQFQLYRYDDPETWLAEKDLDEPCKWQVKYREPIETNLNYVEHALKLMQSGGQAAVRQSINGPGSITKVAYAKIRLDAARRATDEERLSQIRNSWNVPAAHERMPRAEIIWNKLQFLYDVRLARGEISPDDFLQNSRGFKGTWREEWKSALGPWQVMQNWTQIAYPVKDWLNIPADVLQRPKRDQKTRLANLIALFDQKLFKQVVQDLNDWRDLIEKEQLQGVIPNPLVWRKHQAPFVYDDQVEPGGMHVDMRNGNSAREAAVLLRTYEILGDKRFLNTGLKFCDFLVNAQLDPGFWARTYIVNPGEPIKPAQMRHFSTDIPREERLHAKPWLVGPESTCRIQDGYQYFPFALLLYAHQLTGEPRYFEAARRVADVIHSLWNANGSWPDEWDFSLPPCEGPQSTQRGVRMGGSFNDGATTNCLRMMLLMHHLTGDEKYLLHFDDLGQWMFDTQIGEGDVRGWCQQYGLDNKPISARNFEMAVIEPRAFSRFIAPMCGWYYAITGEQRYFDLLRKAYFWLRSVEKTEGWAYAYLPDGSPAFSYRFRVFHIEEIENEQMNEVLADSALNAKYGYSREIVQLKCAEQILHLIESGGRQKLCEAINGTPIGEVEFMKQRIAAARRVIIAQRESTIKQQWSVPDDKVIRKEDALPRLQFIFDVLMAEGKISAEFLRQLNRGFQYPHFNEKWEIAGDWTSQSASIDDWTTIPRKQK
ncbi:hypothetical protein JXJ21_00570 [candidate division KSB1 bacterium]|nr:hypothetical protein [candidate division KSB1 bacterium]